MSDLLRMGKLEDVYSSTATSKVLEVESTHFTKTGNG